MWVKLIHCLMYYFLKNCASSIVSPHVKKVNNLLIKNNLSPVVYVFLNFQFILSCPYLFTNWHWISSNTALWSEIPEKTSTRWDTVLWANEVKILNCTVTGLSFDHLHCVLFHTKLFSRFCWTKFWICPAQLTLGRLKSPVITELW